MLVICFICLWRRTINLLFLSPQAGICRSGQRTHQTCPRDVVEPQEPKNSIEMNVPPSPKVIDSLIPLRNRVKQCLDFIVWSYFYNEYNCTKYITVSVLQTTGNRKPGLTQTQLFWTKLKPKPLWAPLSLLSVFFASLERVNKSSLLPWNLEFRVLFIQTNGVSKFWCPA